MIGPHAIDWSSARRAVVARWKPKLMVLFGDPPPAGAVAEVKFDSPGTAVVARVYKPDEEIAARILANPVDAARWACDLLIERGVNRNPDADWYQFNNEVCQISPDQIRRLNEFTLELFRIFPRKLAYGCFSVGQPQLQEIDGGAAWQEFYPAMRAGKAGGHLLLLHAYGARRMYETDETYYLHRFERRVIPQLPADLRDVPYGYGEYGSDLGINNIAPKHGWKSGYQGDWRAYVEDLKRAAGVLAQFPNCRGAAIFTLGAGHGWDDFDIEGEPAEALASTAWPRSSAATTPPPVVPPAEPPPVAPPPPPATSPAPAGDREVSDNDVTLKIQGANVAAGQGYWKAEVEILDDTESRGLVHIFARVIRDGQRVVGAKVRFGWPSDQVETDTEAKPLDEWGDANFGMSGGWLPDQHGPGPYWAEMVGAPSERVTGMGLPYNRHYVYRIRFVWAAAPAIPTEETKVIDKILPVPGVGQMTPDADAAGDCLLGSVCGKLEFDGIKTTPDQLVAKYGLPKEFDALSVATAETILRGEGYVVRSVHNATVENLAQAIDAGRSVTVLGNYQELSEEVRWDKGPTEVRGHFVEVKGYRRENGAITRIYYNDPYWPGPRGGDDMWLEADRFDRFWGTNHKLGMKDRRAIFATPSRAVAPQPAPARGLLPEDEEVISPEHFAEKSRWWHQEYRRKVAAKKWEEAEAISASLEKYLIRGEETFKRAA